MDPPNHGMPTVASLLLSQVNVRRIFGTTKLRIIDCPCPRCLPLFADTQLLEYMRPRHPRRSYLEISYAGAHKSAYCYVPKYSYQTPTQLSG